MIAFNKPPFIENSIEYIRKACEQNNKICGDGSYTALCSAWLEQNTGTNKVLLTTSCSHALDMMAILADIHPGDEVIMPSYNFVSAANAVASRGGLCVFVDINPGTMNIDPEKTAYAVTPNTKAIFVMHYAGVSCDMDRIKEIADKYDLTVLEDAAQGMMSTYKGRALGTLGRYGSYSFHETKNYSMGEGGCLIINNPADIEKAEILREKGTDRSKFWRGQVDKYTWQDLGSSYLPSDINAAYMYAQLEIAEKINKRRLEIWNKYDGVFRPLELSGRLRTPRIPAYASHNGHMYYLKLRNLSDRTNFIAKMKERGIMTPFHYVPLHSAPAGAKYGRFDGEDIYTTKESEKLVRLPLYYSLSDDEVDYVINNALDVLKE